MVCNEGLQEKDATMPSLIWNVVRLGWGMPAEPGVPNTGVRAGRADAEASFLRAQLHLHIHKCAPKVVRMLIDGQ